MAPVRYVLAPKYQSILTSLKTTPPEELRTQGPTDLLQYGLTEVEVYNPAAGVPRLICGYILPFSWLATFARRDDGKLCRSVGIDPQTGDGAIAGHVVSCLSVMLKLRVNPTYLSLPGGKENMVLFGVESNMPGRVERLDDEHWRFQMTHIACGDAG
ncbi:hypothetical protein EIP91_009779 [Steccherinum ochraceum]|uniref:Uncharacterized protein n=1 Tax=Steccherinum ochraceum TaxID=92696 RepID=A0A4R0R3W2_9APHY|nr:hypothetical protein EIP91_009779 [Steccherinum ochraceum]